MDKIYMQREITIEESFLFKDHAVNPEKEGALNGFVVVRDENGEILVAKKNLVVRSGRSISLRKIFGIADTAQGETTSALDQKTVLLFGIGSGGAPASDPFNPTPPTPSDTYLSNHVPFRSSTVALPLSQTEEAKYADPRTVNGTTFWYKKLFSNGRGEFVVDSANDRVYNKLQLQITDKEARDTFINEISLFYTQYSSSGLTQELKYTNHTLFSRFTFQTEPLPSNTNKALNIDYYVYL